MTYRDKIEITRVAVEGMKERADKQGVSLQTVLTEQRNKPAVTDGIAFTKIIAAGLLEAAETSGATVEEALETMLEELNNREASLSMEQDND